MKRLRAQTCRILTFKVENRDRNRIKTERVVREMEEEPEKSRDTVKKEWKMPLDLERAKRQ